MDKMQADVRACLVNSLMSLRHVEGEVFTLLYGHDHVLRSELDEIVGRRAELRWRVRDLRAALREMKEQDRCRNET